MGTRSNRSKWQSHLIVMVIGCIFISIGCLSVRDSPSKHKVLLISFDGFRADYLATTATPNFDAFIKEGVTADGLIPVFPSKTFPNHYSIATGLYPGHHGIVGNTMYDTPRKQWYRVSDREAVMDTAWYGGEPIWNTAMKNGLKTGTVFWIGSEAAIQNKHPDHWLSYNKHMPDHARVDSVIKWMTLPAGRDVDFATLYFEMVDQAGHEYGPSSDSVKSAIRQADEQMGYLVSQLKAHNLRNTTNVIVISDHGMTDLAKDKVIFIDSLINKDDLDYIVPDPMTLIQPKPGRLNKVYDELKAHENHYKVYLRTELPRRYHLEDNPRISDIVLVCDLPYTLITTETYKRFVENLPRGTHGFDSQEKDMLAFFAAAGPDFKPGYHAEAFPNVDVYSLICHLLGIPPAPNDGSCEKVKLMINK